MRYGSVCSGIEAASVAWHPLGWSAAWLAEIEKFPSQVLEHHYPGVPNLGDMTQIVSYLKSGMLEAPDVLVGGTPCQAFSVAGLRNSLEDDRGQLTLTYIHILDAIDAARRAAGQRPAIALWENVPGVLNTHDNAFGCFIAGLAGFDEALKSSDGKWAGSGVVRGPERTVAWRTLDAQYFGVAQRRRRVFVVASAGGVCPSSILFESEGVRRDTPPSREKREGVTRATGVGFTPSSFAQYAEGCGALRSQGGDLGGGGSECLVLSTGQAGAEIGIGTTLNCNHEAPIVTYPLNTQIITRGGALGEGTGFGMGEDGEPAYTLQAGHSHAVATSQYGDVAGSLTARHDSSPCADRGQNVVCFEPGIAKREGDAGRFIEECCSTLRKDMGDNQPAVAYGIRTAQTSSNGWGVQEEMTHTLDQAQGIAVASQMQVRRLTPVECERLQGFPDDYTNIKPNCPDGPRYKALGNSMAVPVMRWIGGRIDAAVRG